jgi:hypothetical protein
MEHARMPSTIVHLQQLFQAELRDPAFVGALLAGFRAVRELSAGDGSRRREKQRWLEQCDLARTRLLASLRPMLRADRLPCDSAAKFSMQFQDLVDAAAYAEEFGQGAIERDAIASALQRCRARHSFSPYHAALLAELLTLSLCWASTAQQELIGVYGPVWFEEVVAIFELVAAHAASGEMRACTLQTGVLLHMLEGVGKCYFQHVSEAPQEAAAVAHATIAVEQLMIKWLCEGCATMQHAADFLSITGKHLRVQLQQLPAVVLQSLSVPNGPYSLDLPECSDLLCGAAACSSGNSELVVKLLQQLLPLLQAECNEHDRSGEAARAVARLLQGLVWVESFAGQLGPAQQGLVSGVTSWALLLAKLGRWHLTGHGHSQLLVASMHVSAEGFQLGAALGPDADGNYRPQSQQQQQGQQQQHVFVDHVGQALQDRITVQMHKEANPRLQHPSEYQKWGLRIFRSILRPFCAALGLKVEDVVGHEVTIPLPGEHVQCVDVLITVLQPPVIAQMDGMLHFIATRVQIPAPAADPAADAAAAAGPAVYVLAANSRTAARNRLQSGGAARLVCVPQWGVWRYHEEAQHRVYLTKVLGPAIRQLGDSHVANAVADRAAGRINRQRLDKARKEAAQVYSDLDNPSVTVP